MKRGDTFLQKKSAGALATAAARFFSHLPKPTYRLIVMAVLAFALGISTLPVKAAQLLPGFAETLVASGLDNATTMQFAPDGRLFVALQGGQLRVIKNDVLLPTPFLTVKVDTYNERGLSGIAFDPNFATTPYVYVYYTATTKPDGTPYIHNRLSRFTANGDVAVPGSEVILLDLDPVGNEGMHNAGALRFGRDGKLYVAVGDNGTSTNAQSLNNLFGKILRLNPDGSIPTDNPFYGTATGDNRAIWALGLRNPFSFQFQPGTGRMFINDVGGSKYEEINDGVARGNYGWPDTEGPVGTSTGFTGPIYAYTHQLNQITTAIYPDCAITGGAFYNPATTQFPSQYVGKYFFTDFCGRWINMLDPATGNVTNFANVIYAPVDLKVGPDGSLYYLDRGAPGIIRKIRYVNTQAPTISQNPSNVTASVGGAASFTVSANGATPLSYQWQRNGVNISGATTATYTIPSVTTADNGATFRAVVTNAYGSVTSSAATLTVTSNRAPTATITLPTVTTYQAGDTIQYAGTGSDPEDSTLPPSAFTWKVDFHHGDHFHPFMADTTGSQSGSFVISRTGESSADTWYRIHLTVTDSGGLTNHIFKDIFPKTSQVTIQTNPSGLQTKLDGQPQTTPYPFTGVVAYPRTLEALSPQTLNGTTYVFSSWSDGGAATHTIDTPATNTTYTANFVPSGTTGGTGTGLTGQYYGDMAFGALKLTRTDPTVDFTWAYGTPDPSVPADHFSVRWTGQVVPRYGETYTFYTESDDGVRLWVDDQPLINNWTNHGQVTNTNTITLQAGRPYNIRLEYYENDVWSIVSLSWSSASQPKQIIPQSQLYPTTSGTQTATPLPPTSTPTNTPVATSIPPTNTPVPPTSTAVSGGTVNGLTGQYYGDLTFGALKLTRTDPTVDFAWAYGAPDPSVPADHFTVRWTGQIVPRYSETYNFYTESDDGVRLWVGDTQLINNWTNHGQVTNTNSIRLQAGQRYNIRLEYYENEVWSIISLSWSSASQPKQIIPQSQLFAASTGPTNTPTNTPTRTPTNTPTSTPMPTTNSGPTDTPTATPPSPSTNTPTSTPTNTSTSTPTNIPPSGGGGNGLRGEYYDSLNFVDLKLIRTDPTVNFVLNSGTPSSLIAPDTFSVRWTGQIVPLYSETYTFYTQSDDGARLWVSGNLLVNNWTSHSVTENSGTIRLQAGQRYNIQLEYYDGTGDSMITLLWSSTRQPKQIIPQSQMFSPVVATASASLMAAGASSSQEQSLVPLPTQTLTTITGTEMQTIESDDAKIMRTSGWVSYSNPPGSSGGSYLINTSASDTLTMSFVGTSVEVRYVQQKAFGSFVVLIDGSRMQVVNSRGNNAFRFNERVVISGLADQQHTLQIVPQNSVIAIDAIVVNPASAVTAAPPQTGSTIPVSTPLPTREQPAIVTDTAISLPSVTPTTQPIVDTLPYAENFDSAMGWVASGTWRLDTQITRSGTAWLADASTVGMISMLVQGTTVDLTSVSHPQLSFWQRSNLATNDIAAVDVSLDGGTSWTIVDQQVGLQTDWSMRTVDLTAYQGHEIRLRFRLQTLGGVLSSDDAAGYWIDDLAIVEVEPSAITEATLSPTDTGSQTATETPVPAATATLLPSVLPSDTPMQTVILDTDNDGFADGIDQCPVEAGSGTANGCPLPPSDIDGDGVADEMDQCPAEAAPGTTSGCLLTPIVAPTQHTGSSESQATQESETK
jgi:glucose/arabinose dehydrogenase